MGKVRTQVFFISQKLAILWKTFRAYEFVAPLYVVNIIVSYTQSSL